MAAQSGTRRQKPVRAVRPGSRHRKNRVSTSIKRKRTRCPVSRCELCPAVLCRSFPEGTGACNRKMSQDSPFTVRRYRAGDGEAFCQICRQSPQAAQWPKETYDQADSSGQIVLTAELNGKICGFLVARIIGEEAEILNMAVVPSHRRNGIGSALLTAAISAAP